MTVVVLGAVCHVLQQHRASRAGQRVAETRQGAMKILDIKIINQFAIQLNDFERIISSLPAKSALLPGRLQTPLWRRPRSASWRSCWSRIVWELSRQLCYRLLDRFTMDLIKNFNLKLWIQYIQVWSFKNIPCQIQSQYKWSIWYGLRVFGLSSHCLSPWAWE